MDCLKHSRFEMTMISSSHTRYVITLYFCLVIWFKIVSDTCWFKWFLNSLVSLLWSKIRNGFIWMFIELQMWLFCFGVNDLMKMAFDLCIATLYELWNVLRWYMHIWDCVGCYCAINNKALDCRTVKEEGPFRANVVEGLAFKCA